MYKDPYFEKMRIIALCEKYGIKNYTIHDDLTISVDGDVDQPLSTNVSTREEKRRDKEQPLFETFWKAYPKKVAKPDALKAWVKAKINGDFEKVLQALERYKQSDQWTKDEGKFVPHPATWLNKRRFEDELELGTDDYTAGAR